MSGYLSNLLTNTTSRVANLRQNLLPNENDGDTVDDTHLARVMRGYYTEKGRNLPGWLPPDPKAPVVVPQQPVYTSNVGATYGGGMAQQQGGAAGRGSSLSSLWDSKPGAGAGAGPVRVDPDAPRPTARRNPFDQRQKSSAGSVPEPRPLPSQRLGSYQATGAFNTSPRGNEVLSAKDKLRRGFQKGETRSQSPVAAAPVQSGYQSSSGGGDYDPFRAPERGYGGARRGGSREQADVYSNSPWSDGNGYDPQAQSGRQEQPPPAAGRRGPGLPNGPRGYR